jgi:Fe-S oxidoreductase
VETVAPFAEITEEIKKAGGDPFKLCYQCGKCDVVCPWNKVRNFSIRKIIREASFGLTEVEGEEIWRCTTCGTCPAQCPRGVEQIEVGVSLRRLATEYGVFPETARTVRSARGSLTTEGNPLSEDRSKRADWAKSLSVKPFAEGMEVLYFVGCYFSYDPRLKKAAIATARILDQAGVDFGILGTQENCCGESIRKTGGEDVFKTLARENIKTFVDHGVTKILVSSPHCYHTFKNEYPEFMVNFEVVHISQYLSGLINEGRLTLNGEYAKKVTYHDPCYLGRHNDIYDAPREVLKKVPGLELIELPDSRADSLCCGGGGGRIWMDTPRNERFSDLRLQQAKESGAEVLVTACPYCITNFEDSRLSFKQSPTQASGGGRLNLEDDQAPEIKDITEIVQEVI